MTARRRRPAARDATPDTVRDAVLTAVDVAHTAKRDPGPVWALLGERIGGDPARADQVTVTAVFVAAELLVALADAHGVERARMGGWFDGRDW